MPWFATPRIGGRVPPKPTDYPFVRLTLDHPSVPTCHSSGRRAWRGQGWPSGHRQRRRAASLTTPGTTASLWQGGQSGSLGVETKKTVARWFSGLLRAKIEERMNERAMCKVPEPAQPRLCRTQAGPAALTSAKSQPASFNDANANRPQPIGPTPSIAPPPHPRRQHTTTRLSASARY